ncbi:MAG: SRPBCC family protein [Actinomycetota bacterium]
MPTVQVTRTTDKSPEALWDVLADFPNIANWYSGLKTSVSTSEAFNGVGATRHCELAPVGAIDERILAWEERSHVRIAAEKYEKAPIKHAIADFRIVPDGDQTRLDLSFDFTAKGGVAGKAATPALKAALTKGFNQMLEDWEAAA